jgi:tRNA threonylcarbamoyladenosine biosynthesis protein TsaB
MLEEVGAKAPEIERVVIGDGPGSFTGLRIGFATAYGLRTINPDIELLAIPSLAAVALGASSVCSGPVAALFDAMRGEFYAGIYEFDSAGSEILKPGVWSLDELMREYPLVSIATGEGLDESAEAISRWTGREPMKLDEKGPVASQLLNLAGRGLFARRVEKAADFRLNYGRLPAAQDKWEKENEKELPNQTG